MTYGQVETSMAWGALDGPNFRSPGTDRLSIGVETPELSPIPLRPQLTAELDFDRGATEDLWMRGSIALSLVRGNVEALVGGALSTYQRSRSYAEVGVLVGFDRLSLGFGLRFGADPVPGDSYSFGGEVHAK
ncbi:MAG: hypothetical protein SGJ01_11110 [Gemmatimonadota bacterium]|nr:hypothetical protein [Gemmatimonadota bacterium]